MIIMTITAMMIAIMCMTVITRIITISMNTKIVPGASTGSNSTAVISIGAEHRRGSNKLIGIGGTTIPMRFCKSISGSASSSWRSYSPA